MSNTISGMKPAIYDMAASTNSMQRDFWSLNKNVSTPLSFMNNFLPWKDDQSLPFQGSEAPLPQSYFAYPAQHPNYGRQGFPNPPQLDVIPGSYTVPVYNSAPISNPSVAPAGMAESKDQSSFNKFLPETASNTASIN